MGILDAPGYSRNQTDARYPKLEEAARLGGFHALRAMLDAGESAAMSILTDSTGNAVDEWVHLFADHIGDKYPGHTIRVHPYDAATFKWGAPTVVQAGAAGDRKVTFDGTTGAARIHPDTALTSPTGDLDIRVKASAPNWALAGEHMLVSKFNNGGERAWAFDLDGTNLKLWHTADGTTLISKSVAQSGLVNGTPSWLRVTLDVDNGASGHTATFYRSADGVTWTQIGTPQTVAGVTTIADVNYPMNIGAAHGGTGRQFAGSIYEVEVRSGIDGQIIAPTLPDLWEAGPSTYNGVTSGAPVLDIWNAAASGFGITNFIANANTMIPAVGSSLALIGSSHNDGGRMGLPLWNDWDTVLASVTSRLNSAAIGVFSQNPRTTPASAFTISTHARRRAALVGYAAQRGYQMYDPFKAFLDSNGAVVAGLVSADGIHPTPTGSHAWADYMSDAFDRRI